MVMQTLQLLEAQVDGNRLRALASSDRRELVHNLVAEAHARDIPIEQVIIALKDAWFRSEIESRSPHARNADDMLGRTITMCINEFYEPSSRTAAV